MNAAMFHIVLREKFPWARQFGMPCAVLRSGSVFFLNASYLLRIATAAVVHARRAMRDELRLHLQRCWHGRCITRFEDRRPAFRI